MDAIDGEGEGEGDQDVIPPSGKNKADETQKEECRSKIELGEWIVTKKSRRGLTSYVWGKFGEVKEKATNKYMGFVQCFGCHLVKLFKGGSSTSPLKKHNCPVASAGSATVSVTAEMKEKFKEACVDFCTGDIRPYNTVAGDQFAKLIQTAVDLGAKHGKFDVTDVIGDSTTVSRAAAVRADKAREETIPEISEATQPGYLSLTTDMWTESYRKTHYLTVTCHLVDTEFELSNLVLFTKAFAQELSETGENIRDELMSELKRLNIPPEKVVFVTDGGANVVKALSLCGIRRIYCIDHCLNIILKSTFTLKLVDLDLYGEAGENVFDWACVAAAYVKATEKNPHKKLKPIPSVNPLSSSRIFKSRIPFIESMKRNYKEVTKLINSGADQGHIAHKLNLDQLTDICVFMTPIENAAKNQGNDLSEITLGWLSSHIMDKDGDSLFMQQLKANARQQLVSVPTLQLLAKCKSIVAYFKRTGAVNLLCTSLKQEIDVRWNSHLLMLLSFPRNFIEINNILQEKEKREMMLSEAEQAHILALIEFLKAFKTESEKLESDLPPTLHMVLLAMHKLDQHCSPVPSDTQGMAKLRARAKDLLKKKFVADQLHKIAAFFWPDFRNLRMLSHADREEPRSTQQSASSALNCCLLPPLPSLRHLKSSMIRQFLNPLKSNDFWRDNDSFEQEDELLSYISAKTGTCSGDKVIEWWKEKAIRFPSLARVARAVLGISATSASSERIFSTAGCIISSRRASLDPSSVDNILFLNRYLKMKKRKELHRLQN